MANAISAAIAPLFMKAKNSVSTPLCALLVEAAVVAVVAVTTFDSTKMLFQPMYCAQL